MGLTLDEGREWVNGLMGLGSCASLLNARARPLVRVHPLGPRSPRITNQVHDQSAKCCTRSHPVTRLKIRLRHAGLSGMKEVRDHRLL